MSTNKIEIGCQLYTLRDLAKTDMAGTLRAVADMGYRNVELIDFGNLPLPQLKDTLAGLNLTVTSQHFALPVLQTKLADIIGYSGAFGYKFVICPWVPPEWRTAEKFRELGRILDGVGGKLREAGLQLCYHHHDFEFQRFDGKYGLDLLFENADPRNLHLQLDTYWVKKGGEDPAAYLRKFAGRVPLVHLKDMAGDDKNSFAEVGAGILDWKAIFSAAETAGVRYGLVEQDTCPRDPLDCVRVSFENLKKMGRA